MAPSLNEKTQVQVERKDPQVGVASGAHKWLVAIGVLVLLVWVGLLVINWQFGNEITETTKTATGETAKTTETKELASETLLSALLGVGAALILVGFLYARISSIKLPGGTELGFLGGNLTEDEKKATAEKVADALPRDTPNSEVAAATVEATAKVAQAKAAQQTEALAASTGEVADDLIDAVVAEVTP